MRVVLTSKLIACVFGLIFLSAAALAPACGQTPLQPLPLQLRQVSDAAGVMSVEERRALSHLLTEIEEKTRTKIVIAVLPTVADESIAAYTERLERRWLETGKLRQGERFVFVVIATEDRLLRLWPSSNLNRILDPFDRSDTMRRAFDLLRNKKYYDALTTIVQKLSELVAENTA